MASLNLFANIDNLSTDDVNYSFGEVGNNDDDIVDLPEETKPTTANSKSKRRRGKAKSNPDDLRDSNDSDNETSAVSPGVGQKTAFKKLSKLKQSLATTAVKPTTNQNGTRSAAMNSAIQKAVQQKRMRRTRRTDTSEIEFTCTTSDVFRPNIVNESMEEEELSVFIKIKWEGTFKVERLPFSMYKTFNQLVDELSTREKVDAKSFLLMFGNHVIKPDDSPHSIGYTLGKFISVRVVDNPKLYATEPSATPQNDTIEVKVQSPQWKKPMICNIKLTDQFKVLVGMCSEKLNCNPSKIRLKFDGDIIDINSTLDDLDFEGGEIIDLLVSD